METKPLLKPRPILPPRPSQPAKPLDRPNSEFTIEYAMITIEYAQRLLVLIVLFIAVFWGFCKFIPLLGQSQQQAPTQKTAMVA